jgi:hypothetical protein
VTTLGEGQLAHTLPWPLPDGRALLYTVRRRSWSWGDEEIVALTLGTGKQEILLRNAADARYMPTGHLVFLRMGKLFAARFDAERLKFQGPAVAVLETVAQALTSGQGWDNTGAGQFTIAAIGTLAWIPGPVEPYGESALVTVDRRGQVSPLSAPVRSYLPFVRLSPDGRRLAVTIRSLTEESLWIYDVGHGTLTPLIMEGESEGPVWSPDGLRLVFSWFSGGRHSLAAQAADGASPPQVIVAGQFLLPSSWTPDGRQVAALHTEVGGDILMVPVEHVKAGVQPLFQTPHTERWPTFSPDGRWLAYGSDVSGRLDVYVRPYPGPGAAARVSVDGGSSPAWNPHGSELFFVSAPDPAGNRRMMLVEFEDGAPPRIGRPRPLFEFDPYNLMLACTPVRCYDIAPDGQRFYTTQARTPAPPPVVTHINLIQNWFEELKSKVPASGQAK